MENEIKNEYEVTYSVKKEEEMIFARRKMYIRASNKSYAMEIMINETISFFAILGIDNIEIYDIKIKKL